MKLITIVFDYLGAYYKDLGKELNVLFGPKVARLTTERSQKWVISQNCEIVKVNMKQFFFCFHQKLSRNKKV